MISKKIVLSVLVIVFVGVAAASGTWATYKDTLNVKNTEIGLMPWDVSVKAAAPGEELKDVPFEKGVATIEGCKAENIDPSVTSKTVIQQIEFTNRGSPAILKIHGETDGGSTMPTGITIWVDGFKVYYSGHWVDRSITLADGTENPDVYIANVACQFDSNINNNDDAGKEYKFDLTFTVTPSTI